PSGRVLRERRPMCFLDDPEEIRAAQAELELGGGRGGSHGGARGDPARSGAARGARASARRAPAAGPVRRPLIRARSAARGPSPHSRTNRARSQSLRVRSASGANVSSIAAYSLGAPVGLVWNRWFRRGSTIT